jgi:choice-of-anchor A domain-containing protein
MGFSRDFIDIMKFILRSRSIPLAAALIALAAQGASADINLGDFNLITSGSVTGDNSDVQGRVLVGGTLSVNGFNFGGHLSGSSLTPPAGIFNALAGNVTSLDNNGHNFIFGSGNTVNSPNSPVSATPNLVAPYVSGLSSYLSMVSSDYAGLATNSTVTASDRNQISFAATPTMIHGQSVAVFSVDQSFFSSNGTVNSITTNGVAGFAAGTTVVINVTGGTPGNDPLSFGTFSPFQNIQDSANIIFNFENATSLTGVNNLGGSILAPNADLNTGSSLVGSIYVKSISNTGEIDQPFSSGTEVHGFSGYVPAVSVAVPEPASVASTLAGLAIAGVAAWRRRRRAA